MNQEKKYRIFSSASDVAAAFADEFAVWSDQQFQHQSRITVALSGGSTPRRLFEIWGMDERQPDQASFPDQSIPSLDQELVLPEIQWDRIHFFWGDERCVPPSDPESNFGVAQQLWLSKISIDPANIHRVFGESDPAQEAVRYQHEIRQYVSCIDEIPRFDLVILGMGADGHVASIFPDQLDLLNSPNVCAVANHPSSGQRRITITGNVINHAGRIVFLITGGDKAAVLRQVIEQVDNYQLYPAAHVNGPQVEFFLDEAAARELN